MPRATLYAFPVSHPSNAVELMLAYKGIDYKVVGIVPGFHPLMLRAFGFRGSTVPALRIDGRRVESSLAISRALDEMQPEPPLFPSDPELRERVEQAERWGNDVFQEVPRRMTRWSLHHSVDTVEWLIRSNVRWLPFKRFNAWLNKPVSTYWARRSEATEELVKRDLAAAPEYLDEVDRLIVDGVIGGETPNAADFQIGMTVRVMMAAPITAGLIEGRPCAELARRLMPEYPGEPIPLAVPAEWLPEGTRPVAVGSPN